MELLLQRLRHDADGTLSVLFVQSEVYAFVPEDPPQDVKIKGHTRIPAGRYRLTLEDSPKFSPKYGHRMLTVCDVPGFEGIRVHRGNSPADTMGCILPNAHVTLGEPSLFYMSDLAYKRMYQEVAPFIEQGGEAWITIRDEDYLFAPNLRTHPITVG